MADEEKPIERGPDGKFLPGNKGGPGRPTYSLTAFLRQHGSDTVETLSDGTILSYAEKLSLIMWKQAVLDGDKAVAATIFDRLDGKARERIQVSGDPESNPIYVMLSKLTEANKDKDAK